MNIYPADTPPSNRGRFCAVISRHLTVILLISCVQHSVCAQLPKFQWFAKKTKTATESRTKNRPQVFVKDSTTPNSYSRSGTIGSIPQEDANRRSVRHPAALQSNFDAPTLSPALRSSNRGLQSVRSVSPVSYTQEGAPPLPAESTPFIAPSLWMNRYPTPSEPNQVEPQRDRGFVAPPPFELPVPFQPPASFQQPTLSQQPERTFHGQQRIDFPVPESAAQRPITPMAQPLLQPPAGSPKRHENTQQLLDQFSFNFKEAPWELVLRQFAQQYGMSLQVSHPMNGKFTYFDSRQYSMPEALDVLNDYLLANGGILVKQKNNLVLLDSNSTIPDGLIPFVQLHAVAALGRNELATIAIPVDESDPVSAAEEMSRFLSSLGRAQPLTNSGRVIVTDTGAYLRRIYDMTTGTGTANRVPRSSVYELRHSAAEEVAEAINKFYSSRVQAAGGATASGSSGGQVVVPEKTTNSLIVRDGLANSAEVLSMIQQLDRAPREVLIQAVLVEVQLGNTDEFGVEVGFQDSVLFDRSVIDNIVSVTETVTSPVGTQTTNQRIVSQTAAPGFSFNNQPLGNNVTISPATVAGQALSSFGVGRVNGDLGFGGLVLSAGSESVNVLLRALSARFDIDILSRPQIRGVDNREALIQIGQQVPIVDGVSVTAVGSANPVIRQDQAGIILKVTPRISPESRVLIDVNAEKSSFQLAPGTGVPIFTDATNGNVIEAPVKDITTARTTVSVQTGQTIVLGGMITKENAVIERKVPFLGDIPIIRHAFRHDINESTRRELLIFLTPYVVESRAHSDMLKDKEMGHIKMPCSAGEFGEQLYGTPGSSGHSGYGEILPQNDGAVPVGSPSGHGGF